jgi:hypothetical protein
MSHPHASVKTRTVLEHAEGLPLAERQPFRYLRP